MAGLEPKLCVSGTCYLSLSMFTFIQSAEYCEATCGEHGGCTKLLHLSVLLVNTPAMTMVQKLSKLPSKSWQSVGWTYEAGRTVHNPRRSCNFCATSGMTHNWSLIAKRFNRKFATLPVETYTSDLTTKEKSKVLQSLEPHRSYLQNCQSKLHLQTDGNLTLTRHSQHLRSLQRGARSRNKIALQSSLHLRSSIWRHAHVNNLQSSCSVLLWLESKIQKRDCPTVSHVRLRLRIWHLWIFMGHQVAGRCNSTITEEELLSIDKSSRPNGTFWDLVFDIATKALAWPFTMTEEW